MIQANEIISKYDKYPHLNILKMEIERTRFGSKEYWKMRCEYLEKTLDETFSVSERENCREFYMMLKQQT